MTDFSLPIRQKAVVPVGPIHGALRSQANVIRALILHDMKSRFFGNGLGYVVTILWPTVHMVIIMGIFIAIGRPVPYGQSALLYAATGVLPYIAWNYISRFMSLGMVINRNFLSYPVIKPLDMMHARLILECVTTFIITAGTLAVLVLCQAPAMPNDPGQAVLGLLSAVALGIGFGYLVSVFAMIHHFYALAYVLVLILFWATSGLAINPEAMPEQIGAYLAWNPLLHSIEWIRASYYSDFPAHLLDKGYVLKCAGISFVLGLVLERLLRPITIR